MAETTRRHPFNAVYDTGEELFLGTCDSRGVGGVGVLVNTSLSMNIDSYEQLLTRIGRLRLKRRNRYRQDNTFFKVIIRDSNARIGPRRSSEERHIGTHGLEWNEQSERLSEFIMA
uniref:Pepsin-I3 domain-containing protein n=1 Tax=Angiostrongylus cantonensis TaxID=6313 RepID=A0A0K0D0P7_ANGCA